MVRVTKTQGAVLKVLSIRKVENHCITAAMWSDISLHLVQGEWSWDGYKTYDADNKQCKMTLSRSEGLVPVPLLSDLCWIQVLLSCSGSSGMPLPSDSFRNDEDCLWPRIRYCVSILLRKWMLRNNWEAFYQRVCFKGKICEPLAR